MRGERVKQGQLSIEFILLMVLSFMVLFSFAYVIMDLSGQKNQEKTYFEINNLGVSLQQEFLLASELENGYQRTIVVPETLNNLPYTIFLGSESNATSYLAIEFQGLEFVYSLPTINGIIQKGDNHLTKINNTLQLN